VRGSRFYSGYEGHLIKSRARENRITYNLIYDGDEGQASYEIDLPNGGLAWIIGNVIGQSPQAQNPVMVAYGSEQASGRRTGCTCRTTASSATPGRRAGSCACSTTACRRSTEVKAVNNISLGLGLFSPGTDGDFSGNRWAFRRRALQSIYTLEFGLADGSAWAGTAKPAGMGGGRSLQPTAEFTLPRGTRPLQPAGGLVAGRNPVALTARSGLGAKRPHRLPACRPALHRHPWRPQGMAQTLDATDFSRRPGTPACLLLCEQP
jgi:hypothetical protein